LVLVWEHLESGMMMGFEVEDIEKEFREIEEL
jgi:hypothetical protein